MKITDILLGEPQTGIWRVRAAMTLLTMGLFLLFVLLQHAEVLLGFIDPLASAWLIAYCLGRFAVLLRPGAQPPQRTALA